MGSKRFMTPKIGGAVYILPNLLTTGNLFFGFFSVVKSLHGNFWEAGIAILLASVFDILDGRVARLTNGTSEFGVQYDSLCDLLSFGLAPAFLMYQFGLNSMGRVGWILCFVFLACGALRLARFNVQSAIGKAHGDFTGLPIPMAATVVATFVAFSVDLQSNPDEDLWIIQKIAEFLDKDQIRNFILIGMAPTLGLLMVSNVAYRSHKSMHFSIVKPFRLLAILVMVVGLLAAKPEMFGFLFCLLYALSGPFEWIIGWKKLENDDDIFTPIDDNDSVMETRSDLVGKSLEARNNKDKP
ncbi:MAG: CDP-diacylglycerol--serine O-phosphatidyltransferase [Bdellovibrionota bacterium]